MTTSCKKEKLWFLDTFVTMHLSASSNTDNISLTEHRVPYGSSPPLHIHHTEDEVFHMLSGEARFVVGGKEIFVKAGDTLVAPKGVPHTFVVTSPEGASWLNVTNRGDFERMVRAASRAAEHDGLPESAGRPDQAQAAALDAACRANGIELIGPPMPLGQVSAAA
jgi:mannose-6-phosphate isomerase-like protein (cupin superfamily)